MRILHYIQDTGNATTAVLDRVEALISSTGKSIDHHILKGDVSTAAVKKMLADVQPDIVHIHACWSYKASMVERMVRKRGIVTITSPHDGLSPVKMNHKFWTKRLPQLMLYQTKMLRKCCSIIAWDEQELQDIIATRLRGASRIEALTTPEDIQPLYRKALDSMCHAYITDEEKQFVCQAVRLANGVKNVAAEDNGAPLSFRRIYIYAYDEDVTEQLLEGAKLMNAQMPPVLDVGTLPRYKNKKAKQRGALIDSDKKTKRIKIPSEQNKEYIASMLLCKAKAIKAKRLTLRHWTELYQLFRNIDFNEDIVAKELKRLGIKSFTKKVQKRLAKDFDLPAGYNIF